MTSGHSAPGAWQAVVMMMINPGQVLARRLAGISWIFALLVSGAAFALFFLQTGLDRSRAGSGRWTTTMGLSVTGFFYGTLGIAFIGLVAWVLSKAIGGRQDPGWVVRAIALSYGSALIYSAVGLLFNVALGWNTAVSFGVTGVLWALGPMMAVFKDLSGGKTFGSILLSTICGALVLLGWGLVATGAAGR
jgi:hypothetical protein